MKKITLNNLESGDNGRILEIRGVRGFKESSGPEGSDKENT